MDNKVKKINLEFSDTMKSEESIQNYNNDVAKAIAYENDNMINKDKLYNDLTKKDLSGNVSVISKVIKKEDGTELFEYIGTNCTTIGCTQTEAQHLFDNVDVSNGFINLITIDSDDTALGTKLPEDWKWDNTNLQVDKSVPRRIIGYCLADDGASGVFVKTIFRRSKAFDINHLVPFYRRTTVVDDPARMMNISTEASDFGADGYLKRTDANNEYQTSAAVSEFRNNLAKGGKYALRATIKDDSENMNSAYFVKLAKFDISQIMVNGQRLLSNEDMTNKEMDVRTRVDVRIKVNAGELSSSYAFNQGKANTRGSTISSFMLVAGRPATITAEDGTLIHTYRDLIVTHRMNTVELPTDDTEMEFLYSIYMV